MKYYGYNHIHKFPQFVTILDSSKECSIDFESKGVEKIAIFVHIFFTLDFYVSTENQSSKLDIEFPCQRMICHPKSFTSDNLRQKILKMLRLLPEDYQDKQLKTIKMI